MLASAMPSTQNNHARRAFSLIELVIVVVIIGIIGAIAIPRMSRGAEGAADSGLTADVGALRSAVALFKAEHGGVLPALATIEAQLTTYSNAAGTANATKTTEFYYGPYLRAIPKLKVGTNKGKNGFVATQGGSVAGWVYAGGEVSANLPDGETDAEGKIYNTY